MQKFSSFGRKKKKNRPKFDIEWLCSKVFNCLRHVLSLALEKNHSQLLKLSYVNVTMKGPDMEFDSTH